MTVEVHESERLLHNGLDKSQAPEIDEATVGEAAQKDGGVAICVNGLRFEPLLW